MSNFILPPNSDLINDLNNISLYSSFNIHNFNFSSHQIKTVKNFLYDMWNDKNVNFTENKKALHFACRFHNAKNNFLNYKNTLIDNDFSKMFSAIKNIKSNNFENITDIIHLGTGGSNLGPKLIYDCFKNNIKSPKCHFISNLDPSPLSYLLKTLNPTKTLIFAISKSFTTQETISNLKRIHAWQKNHNLLSAFKNNMYAVTSSYNIAIKYDFLPENIILFNENIGGRFSIWSPANIITPLVFGSDFFIDFLNGGNSIDEHIYSNLEQSISFNLSKISYFSRIKSNIYTHCIVPYADNLKLLPSYLQQLVMESNGKSLDRNANFTESPSSNIFGYTGTDAQHSFFQSLHQSTLKTSIDLISFKNIEKNFNYIDKDLDEKAFKLLYLNSYAQYQAFKNGDKDYRSDNIHSSIPTKKIVNFLIFDQLNASTFGQIICLYEYKTLIEAAICKINPFDQFGVELGKKIVKDLI